MIDSSGCFKKNEQIIYKEIDGSPVLIDPYRRTLIRLNPAAVEIWKSLDGKNSVSDIIDILSGIFDIDRGELKRDINAFLKVLLDREIIS